MIDEKRIQPIILKGDKKNAYRDPAIVYDGTLYHIFFTWVDNDPNGPWLHLAKIETVDFITYTEPIKLTEANKALNYSSPGNVVRKDGKWVICFQSYCRENGEKYGNKHSRLYTMESDDLRQFSEPKLLRVKGDVPFDEMGRMIDPYLVKKGDEWWCFYKQNGVSYSVSKDLREWTFVGCVDGGENVSILTCKEGYRMFHSPQNGIGIKYSLDLINWEDRGECLTLGQERWTWAKGRITAGTVIDVSGESDRSLYMMLFHGSGPDDEETTFDYNASLGIAYSYDLESWIYK